MESVEFAIYGMSCTSCSHAVEQELKKVIPLYATVSVSPITGLAVVTCPPPTPPSHTLLAAVARAGFRATLLSPPNEVTAHGNTNAEASPEALPHVSSKYLADAEKNAKMTTNTSCLPPPTHTTKIRFHVEGMTCASCVTLIESALKDIPGTQDAQVSLLTGMVTITSMEGGMDGLPAPHPAAWASAIEAHGFIVAPVTSAGPYDPDSAFRKELSGFTWDLCVAWPLALVTLITFFLETYGTPHIRMSLMAELAHVPVGLWVRFVCTTPVQLWAGRRFTVGAYHALRRLRVDMNVLVAVGTWVAYGWSCVVLILRLARATASLMDMFEAAAMLVAFILLGKYLEAWARRKTTVSISALLALAPPEAELLVPSEQNKNINDDDPSSSLFTDVVAPDPSVLSNPMVPSPSPTSTRPSLPPSSAIKIVPVTWLRVDDLVQVRPGARIPADGIVEKGASDVDESMITGEWAPVTKHPGDPVVGGSGNGPGLLVIRLTRVGEDSVVSRMADLIQRAQNNRPQIQHVADFVASLFVPSVIVLSLATLVVWLALGLTGTVAVPSGEHGVSYALGFSVATLVVACPCALGLATPTAIMMGIGLAAREGVLIKSGEALEVTRGVTDVIWDKTGTLTRGQPTVREVHVLTDSPKEEEKVDATKQHIGGMLVPVVACVESRSEHPLGRALAMWAEDQLSVSGQTIPEWTVDKFLSLPGRGLACALSIPVPLHNKEGGVVWDGDGNGAFTTTSSTAEGGGEEEGDGAEAVEVKKACANPQCHCVVCVCARGCRCGAHDPPLTIPGRPHRVLAGTLALLQAHHIPISTLVQAEVDRANQQGATCVLVSLDDHLLGWFALHDAVRDGARSVIATLRQEGITSHLVTGDTRATAETVADVVGMDRRNVFAHALPQDKVTYVERLRNMTTSTTMDPDGDEEEGLSGGGGKSTRALDVDTNSDVVSNRVVCMIGDGINDAPALAGAHVGVSMASGTDLALQTSHIVLMRSDPWSIYHAIRLSRLTYRRILYNFVFAGMYNALLIPVAAGCLVPLGFRLAPWMAGGAMAISSVSVVLSSLFLSPLWRREAQRLHGC